jgi:hypothetical protein
MIKPTIGRVVLFNDGRSDQRVPGLVCYVWSDDMIDIAGFDSNGIPFQRTSVHLCQDDETCEIGQAEWMPYQKDQAAKHDSESDGTEA